MRIATSTPGEVLAGRVGSGTVRPIHRDGGCVNLAFAAGARGARLATCWWARPRIGLTRQLIRYVALPPMSIRGKAEPVQTYEVVGLHSQTTSVGTTMDSTFVGRDRETNELGDLIKARRAVSNRRLSWRRPVRASRRCSPSFKRDGGRTPATPVGPVAHCSGTTAERRSWPASATLHILRALWSRARRAPGLPVGDGQCASCCSAQLLSPNVERTNARVPEAGRHALASAFTSS